MFRVAVPEVLLLDIDLRWGGGDGVLDCLRANLNGYGLPEVLVAGYDSPSFLSHRSGVSIERCFQKPFRPSALLEFMR